MNIAKKASFAAASVNYYSWNAADIICIISNSSTFHIDIQISTSVWLSGTGVYPSDYLPIYVSIRPSVYRWLAEDQQ